MGFIAGSSSASAGTAAGSAIFTFTTAAEEIGENDFVTLDTGSGTIQRANDVSLDLFGSNVPVAATATAITAWTPGTSGCALLLTNPDGSLLYVEGAGHIGSIATPQLIKISADGATVLKLVKLPVQGNYSTFIPLSGNRLAIVQYLSATSITTTVYDANTLVLLSTTNTAFNVACNPFGQTGDGIETANGQIALYWQNQSVRYYAVLNADFTVKTQPVNNGNHTASSLIIRQRLRLSNGGVLFVNTHSTATAAEIVSFDASGNYRNTHAMGGGSGSIDSTQNYGVNHVTQLLIRQAAYVVETGVDRVAFVMLKNAVYSFCILNIATNTILVDSPLGDTNHKVTWCIKGGFAYVLSMYNSTLTLKYATFNLTTNTVVKDLTTLIPVVASSLSINISTAFIYEGDWWQLGFEGAYGTQGPIFWWSFAIDNGAIALKIPRTSTTVLAPIQDVTIANGEAMFLAGGLSINNVDVPLTFGRVDLKYGAYRAGAQIRIHTNGYYTPVYGVTTFPESKLLFRHSVEKALVLGPGVGVPMNFLQQCYLKVNTSILLGVATEDTATREVNVVLSGWANVSEKYNRFQKTIDHVSLNGNKVKNYGAAAYLSGSF